MNRDDYLAKLSGLLNSLSNDEKEKAMQYYREYTEELEENGEDIISKLGTPDSVAKTILADTSESAGRSDYNNNNFSNSNQRNNYNQNNYQNDNQDFNNRKRRESNGCLIAAIIAVTLPITLPLAIAALAVLFSVVVAMFAVAIGFIVADLAIAVAGIASIIAGFAVAIHSPLSMLAFIGTGIMCIGFAILMFYLVRIIWIGAVKVTGAFFKTLSGGRRNNSNEGGVN